MVSISPLTTWQLIAGNSQSKTDVTIVVEDKNIHAHRHYLSLVSPVFKAMFENDTAEAKTGCVTITDISYEGVKAAIDYVYVYEIDDVSMETLFDVYKFFDKYDIENARKQLVPSFEQQVNKENFVAIAQFAWTFSNETILNKCITFLASNSNVMLTKGFIELDQRLIMKLLRKATALASATPKVRTYIPMAPSRRRTALRIYGRTRMNR